MRVKENHNERDARAPQDEYNRVYKKPGHVPAYPGDPASHGIASPHVAARATPLTRLAPPGTAHAGGPGGVYFAFSGSPASTRAFERRDPR